MNCECFICGGSSKLIYNKTRENLPAKYYLCSKCGVVFQNKNEKKVDLKSYYQDCFREVCVDDAYLENQFLNRIPQGQKILKNMEKDSVFYRLKNVFCPSKVLDVGCSSGAIMYVFSKMGFITKGCDVKSIYSSYGKKKGLDIFFGFVEDYVNTSDDKYDYIILSHVLEHFSDPIAIISSLKKILKDDGKLYIEVPNFEHPYDWKELQFFFMYGHEFYYTPTSLRYLLNKCGFCDVKFEENYGGFMYGIFEKNERVIPHIKEGYSDYLYELFNTELKEHDNRLVNK